MSEQRVTDRAVDVALARLMVGDAEADMKQGKISISSPIARALIGKHEGDSITIEAPGGNRDYDIIAVRYVG